MTIKSQEAVRYHVCVMDGWLPTSLSCILSGTLFVLWHYLCTFSVQGAYLCLSVSSDDVGSGCGAVEKVNGQFLPTVNQKLPSLPSAL